MYPAGHPLSDVQLLTAVDRALQRTAGEVTTAALLQTLHHLIQLPSRCVGPIGRKGIWSTGLDYRASVP